MNKRYFFSILIFSILFIVSRFIVSAEDVSKQAINNSGLTSNNLDLKTPDNTTDLKFLIFWNLAPGISDSAYYKPIDSLANYSKKFSRVAFNDNFFNSNNITDYDVVVFPMGVLPLNYSTGKNSVIQKINELVAAGKKIVIISRQGLWWAFNTNPSAQAGKDTAVINFLSDRLGITYLNTLNMVTTDNYYKIFTAKGTPKDPVGNYAQKKCNVIYMNQKPLWFYDFMDVFQSKDNSKFIDIDHYASYDTQPPTDTLLGIRTTIGNARIVYISYGLENIAVSWDRSFYLQRILDWLTEQAPQPGAQIETMQSSLEFGNLVVGDSLELAAGFKNIGQLPLKVDSININDVFNTGCFSITSGGQTPLTLNSSEAQEVKIKFKPKDNVAYTAYLTIKSNSQTYPSATITLNGGGNAGNGPRIISNLSNDTLNFGKINALTKVTLPIVIYNKGTTPLDITEAKITTQSVPFVITGTSTNITLYPQDSVAFSIRYQPVISDRIYNAEFHVLSNAANNTDYKIILHGETEPKGGNVENQSQSPDGLLKLKLTPNPVNGSGMVEYSLNGNESIELNLYLVDAAGRTIKDLHSGVTVPGDYNLEFNSSGLASGNYFIIAKTNTTKAELPIVISK